MRVLYQCEICRRIFQEKEEAERCEARGKPQEYPVGMLFASGYSDIVFAVARNNVDGHANFISAWAARDNGYGDNYNKTCTCLCSGEAMSSPDRSLPAFQRIVSNLTDRNIPVAIWDGEKPVALEEFLAECAC
ncbi:MAG: hypothetical protein C4570_03860 [Ammonifex sp.]|jgi:hypothetical protein|nr:MAG: hypothetical protein C4570_03860 [Ammonifex sp.]